jgi:uncharacterized delta-60 repeat protein
VAAAWAAAGTTAAAITLLLPSAGSAAPGDLVPAFGTQAPLTRGIVAAPGGVQLYAAAAQEDAILAAGTRNGQMVVLRMTQAGALDPAFGSGGIATVGPGVARDVAVSGDRIVVAGERSSFGGFSGAILNGSGAPTASLAPALPNDAQRAGRLVVQPDGKVALSGTALSATGFPSATIVRWRTDGTLDSSFDGDGAAFFAARQSSAAGLARLGDGSLVAVGSSTPSNTVVALAWRVSSGGATLGATQEALHTGNGGRSELRAVATRPDGSLVAVGANNTGGASDQLLVRLTASGAIAGIARDASSAGSPGNPLAGGEAVLSTRDHVLVGGGYDATGPYRVLSLSARTPATLAANGSFAAGASAPGPGSSPGTRRVAVDGQLANWTTGRQGQITGIARLPNDRIVAVANAGSSITNLDTSGQGVIALFEGPADTSPPPGNGTGGGTGGGTGDGSGGGTGGGSGSGTGGSGGSGTGGSGGSTNGTGGAGGTTNPGTTPGTTPPPATNPATLAPRVRSWSLRPATITARRSATLRLTLTRAGRVRLEVQRPVTGRRGADGRCRVARSRTGRACRTWTRTGATRTVRRAKGSSTLKLGVRVTNRRLAVGRYRLVLTPLATSGRASGTPRTIAFRIAR